MILNLTLPSRQSFMLMQLPSAFVVNCARITLPTLSDCLWLIPLKERMIHSTMSRQFFFWGASIRKTTITIATSQASCAWESGSSHRSVKALKRNNSGLTSWYKSAIERESIHILFYLSSALNRCVLHRPEHEFENMPIVVWFVSCMGKYKERKPVKGS